MRQIKHQQEIASVVCEPRHAEGGRHVVLKWGPPLTVFPLEAVLPVCAGHSSRQRRAVPCLLNQEAWWAQPGRLFLFVLVFLNSVPFSRSVASDSLRPHEPQHARPPCPSPTPGVYWLINQLIFEVYLTHSIVWRDLASLVAQAVKNLPEV